jgi:hypothetical protein
MVVNYDRTLLWTRPIHPTLGDIATELARQVSGKAKLAYRVSSVALRDGKHNAEYESRGRQPNPGIEEFSIQPKLLTGTELP